MKFMLFTPHRSFPSLECDSVRLPVADSTDGSFSGSYGIRKGHAKAVISLSEGKISVGLSGNMLFASECSGGFATISDDEVRVTTDFIKEKDS